MKRYIVWIIAGLVGTFSAVLLTAALVGMTVAEPASYLVPDSLVTRVTRVADWFEGHAGADVEPSP